MHIGVDFDNTIVRYDELFHRCALELGLIPRDLPVSKAAVRAYLWSQPQGNTPWTELQGVVYGERMQEAVPCRGVEDFLEFSEEAGIRLSIISHKQEYPALGPRVNLRNAALKWIEDHHFYGDRPGGLRKGDVHFEASRSGKLACIQASTCTHFVDDLPEVFLDAEFPASVLKLLYAGDAHSETPGLPGLLVFHDWRSITEYCRRLLQHE